MKFRKLLGLTMFATGTGCLVSAIAFGHTSAWSCAACCFCTAAICLTQRREPPQEG